MWMVLEAPCVEGLDAPRVEGVEAPACGRC